MPTSKLFLLTGILGVTTLRALAADDPTPAAFPMDRYAAMTTKSPFALATPPAPTAAPQGSFAANWFVGGLARLGDIDFVTIKSRDANTQFSLFGHEPNPANGVSMASVNWSDAVGKSTVVLQLGTETAKLEFNEADLRGPAQPAGAPANPGSGAVPAIGGPSPIPGAAGSNNATKSVLPPRPTHSNGVPVIVPLSRPHAAPSNAGNPGEVQRRDKIINQPR